MPPPPAEAAVQTTTPPARRESRWRKRLAWFFGGLALIICGLGLGGWLGRVSLVNRLFSTRDSVWKIHVESIELQGGKLLLTGLKVNHTDQKEAVFQFAGATTNASWSDLRAGQLGDLVVEDPVVFWRKGLRSDPWKPAAGLAPLFTWRSLKVSRGQADLRSGNDWSLTTGVDGVAGAGMYLNDGRISVASGSLRFKDPVYAMTLEGAPVPGFSVKAGQVSLGGALDSENGLLSLHDAALAGTELEVIRALTADHAQSPPPPAPAALPTEGNPANSSVNDSGSNPVRGVSVSNLRAPGTALKAVAPWKITANTDLSLRRFLWQSGQPGTAQGIQLARSSLTLAGILHIPLLRLEGNLTTRGPQLSLLELAGAEILNFENLLEPLGMAPDSLPSGTAKLDAEFKDIDFFEGRLISSSSQILTLHDSNLTLPEMGTVKIAKILMEGVPDEILKNRRLKRLEVESPDLSLDSPPGIASKPDILLSRPGSAPKPERPAWEGWTADSLTINNGKLALTLPPPSAVKVTATFSALTQTPEGATNSSWQFTLSDPRLTHPSYPQQPIAAASALKLTADPAALWARRELESFEISGSSLSVGEALFQWVKSLPPPSDPAPAPASTVASAAPPLRKAPPWHLKSLVLDGSRVLLENIGDGRRLEIPISHQVFQDLPLDTSALASVDRLYKIEVPNITLYSPFGEGQKVAVLDTNYIQFTPSGLLANRLERVDLMLPSLYAGQPLFDFIDAARQRFTELAAVPPGVAKPLPATTAGAQGNGTFPSAPASVQPVPSKPSNWHIPFYTESGKVLIAPKGFPWPNLPVIPFRNARGADGKPLPFLLEGETFHGELAVEPGWYEFPEYKLRLRINDRGRIIFNIPQSDRDNNLVEVFEHNTVIFRQLRIDDVWLSVTYDDKGIYAKFGGETCGGHITGGFNLYLDELYTWDGWASFSNIQMKPLTDRLTPESFRMMGPLDDLTIKASGDVSSLYQATLALKVSKPGRLEIISLDQLRQSISEIGGLSADLGKIGVGTLRDFDYTGCEGALRLFGTEGGGRLVLTGPAGSRTFNLTLHDYRGRVPRSTIPF